MGNDKGDENGNYLFKSKRKDWDTVRDTIYDSLRPTDIKLDGEDALKAYIERKYPGVFKFLNRLEAVAN